MLTAFPRTGEAAGRPLFVTGNGAAVAPPSAAAVARAHALLAAPAPPITSWAQALVGTGTLLVRSAAARRTAAAARHCQLC
jgi:hypothetical protein